MSRGCVEVSMCYWEKLTVCTVTFMEVDKGSIHNKECITVVHYCHSVVRMAGYLHSISECRCVNFTIKLPQ